MGLIKPDAVDCPRLSVSQDDGFADELRLRLIEFGKDRGRSCFGRWHRLARLCWMSPRGRT